MNKNVNDNININQRPLTSLEEFILWLAKAQIIGVFFFATFGLWTIIKGYSDNILIEERIISREEIKKEVCSEVQNEMPHWNKMTNGAMGGGDRDCFLIRSSKGYYFTSHSVGPNEVYLDLDELENLSKPEGVE